MPSLPPPEARLSADPGTITAEVRAARRAVFIAFIASGFSFASWVSRIPDVRDQLRASPSTLGLVLLAVAAGSLIAMPLAGIVVTKIGAARSVAIMSLILSVGLVVVAVGYWYGIPPIVAGLFLIGFGNGTWDVAMNVEGAAVEQRLGRAIMPKFHAGFSVGTVAGALGGVAMVALSVPVTAHLIGVAVVVAVLVPLSVRSFLPMPLRQAQSTEGQASSVPAHGTNPHPLRAWTEPRTLLIGVFVLCMAFTEGTGNDWLAVAVIDGYQAAPVLGPLALAVFLTAMTAGRWFGPGLIDRYGRVVVLRVSALIALVGLLLVVFGTLLPIAFLGSVLLGLGTALGFPVGMSAAADDPAMAAARVSVVASIGYTAFLAGPPLIGFLGDQFGVLRALTVTAVLLGFAALIAGITRPLAGHDQIRSARPPES
ncbi:MAG TPA: MFS transporter [Microlunatus sp.]